MTAPRPRPVVESLPPYVAGKVPAQREGFTIYKVSSNENPYPPLPGVLEAATAAASDVNRYPDFSSVELCNTLAGSLGVEPDQVVCATGSTALIFQLMSAFCSPGDEVVYPWRSFEAYPIAVAASGATSVQVPNLPDGSHDLDGLVNAITDKTKIVILCTPNNPTGPALTQTEVDRFLDRVPNHVLVLIDEAYTEFIKMADPLDSIATVRNHDNVVVTRTFSKAYGLAGLRVGYAFGPAHIIKPLRLVGLPFGVNNVAQAAAVESIRRQDELLARVDALVAERDRVMAGIREAGWEVPDAQGNFVWFPFPGDADRIGALKDAADEIGLMVRPLGTDGLRVTIGEEEANDRLIKLAQTFEK